MFLHKSATPLTEILKEQHQKDHLIPIIHSKRQISSVRYIFEMLPSNEFDPDFHIFLCLLTFRQYIQIFAILLKIHGRIQLIRQCITNPKGSVMITTMTSPSSKSLLSCYDCRLVINIHSIHISYICT